MGSPVDDQLAFLARSTQRVRILEALHCESHDLRDLRDEVDIPRSTLRDNLDRMLELGWIEEIERRAYRTTTLGCIAIEIFDEHQTLMETAERLAPFLERVPREDVDIDLRHLSEAEVVPPEPGRPYAPDEYFVELLEGSHELRGFSPVVGRITVDAIKRRVEAEQLRIDIVVTTDVLEALESAFEREYREVLDAGCAKLWLYGGEVPYALALVDDTVVLRAIDDSGIPHTLVETDNEAAYMWAEQAFEAYRDEACRSTRWWGERFEPD